MVSYKRLETFYYSLSTSLRSGIDIKKALLLASSSKELTNAVKKITVSLNTGKNLSSSFKESGLFKPVDSVLIEAGEKTGEFPLIFAELSEYYKNKHDEIRKFILSLLPSVIAVVSLIFSVNGHLLFTNKANQFAGRFLTQLFITGGVIAAVFLLIRILYYKSVFFSKFAFNFNLFFIPSLFKVKNLKMFYFIFYIFYRAGYSFERIIDNISSPIDNLYMKNELDSLKYYIGKGQPAGDILKKSSFLNYNEITLINTGENSGSLDTVLKKLYDEYCEKTVSVISNIFKTIGISVWIIIVLVVAYIFISRLFGYFDLISQIEDQVNR